MVQKTWSVLIGVLYPCTTTQVNGGTPVTFTYDSVNELTNDGTQAYTYDLAGNRTMAGYTLGPDNELSDAGAWAYTYDANGNLLSAVESPVYNIATYSYNGQNQLTSVVDSSATATLSAVTYAYDVMGNRLEEDDWTSTGGASTTKFAYDGANVFADLCSSNTLQTRRLYATGVDQLFARISSGGTAAWYLSDYEGSVVGMVNAAGTPQATISYDGFGNVLSNSNSSFTDRYLYTGEQFSNITGLQYNGARYYNPSVGRWTQQDPIGMAGGDTNLYRYAGNDSTNEIDPTGLIGQQPGGGPGGLSDSTGQSDIISTVYYMGGGGSSASGGNGGPGDQWKPIGTVYDVGGGGSNGSGGNGGPADQWDPIPSVYHVGGGGISGGSGGGGGNNGNKYYSYTGYTYSGNGGSSGQSGASNSGSGGGARAEAAATTGIPGSLTLGISYRAAADNRARPIPPPAEEGVLYRICLLG